MEPLAQLWEVADRVGVVALLLIWGWLGYKRKWVWGSEAEEWKEIARAALDTNDRLSGVAHESVVSSKPSSRVAQVAELRRRRRRMN